MKIILVLIIMIIILAAFVLPILYVAIEFSSGRNPFKDLCAKIK